MILIIEKDVLEFVASKNETVVTVDLYSPGNCCVPLSEPHVYFGLPKDPIHKYEYIEQDGLKIYVFKGANLKNDTLKLCIRKFLGMKSIEVEGINLL